MNKKIIIIGVIILLVVVIIGFGINIITRPSIPVVNSPDINITSTSTKISQVQWITPIKTENLNVFKSDFNKTAYIKELKTFLKDIGATN